MNTNRSALPYVGAKAGERDFYWRTWSKGYNIEAAKAYREVQRLARNKARMELLERENEALRQGLKQHNSMAA